MLGKPSPRWRARLGSTARPSLADLVGHGRSHRANVTAGFGRVCPRAASLKWHFATFQITTRRRRAFAYDASPTQTLLSAWNDPAESVRSGFWEGANVYAMILGVWSLVGNGDFDAHGEADILWRDNLGKYCDLVHERKGGRADEGNVPINWWRLQR